MKRFIIIAIAAILFPAFLDPFADRVTQGNGEYKDSKFAEAEKSYKSAEDYAPSSKAAELSYNMGNARFKQNDFDGAIDHYRKALESKNKDVQKKALLNIGNAYLQKKDKRAAADAYMSALRIDPDYAKAKNNLEYLYKQKKDNKDKGKDGKGKDKDKNDSSQGQGKPGQDKKSLDSGQLDRMMEMMKKKPLRREDKKEGGSVGSERDKPW
jgi:tetratricopeptide (TPR) repeat protein